MFKFLNSANSKAGRALTRTLAATAFMAVAVGGIGSAQASLAALKTTTITPFPIVGPYSTVETHLANSETIGAGFDIQLGAFVGDMASSAYTGIFDFNDDGAKESSGKFAAFRFWNPSATLDPGHALTGAGSKARIHEIYFEQGLSTKLNDAPIVYASDGFSFEGLELHPASPPGINPSWGGTYAGLDRGRNKDSSSGDDYHKKSFTGVGEGQWFEIFFATDTLTSTNELLTLLRNGTAGARIAMHIGDCDLRNNSDGSSSDNEHGSNHSDEHSDDGSKSGTSCVIDTWPPGQVTAIPLPAALPLYGTGLAVISFVGWRKRCKAAQV